jgi:hypothetical protein
VNKNRSLLCLSEPVLYSYPICIILPAMSFLGAGGIGRILHDPSYDLSLIISAVKII